VDLEFALGNFLLFFGGRPLISNLTYFVSRKLLLKLPFFLPVFPVSQ